MPLKNYLIKTDGKIICEKTPYLIENDGKYYFEILSLNGFDEREGLFYPSFAARLVVKNGEISSLSDCFSSAKYKNAVELSIIPRVFRPFLPEKILAKCPYTSQNRRFEASVIRGAETVLSAACLDRPSENAFKELLPDDLRELELTARAYGKRQYLILKGLIGDLSYLLAAEIFGDGFGIIFEESADLIETENQTVYVTKKFADMLGRERTEKYVFDGLPAESGAEFFYRADCEYKGELLPYLFLEALGAGDAARAEKYLAADLRGNIRETAEYFGDFYSIDSPEHSDFGINAAALKYRDGKNTLVKYYAFEIEDGLIKNFDEIN
jgi:hypothetical protein